MEVVLDPVTWTDGEAYRVTVVADETHAQGRAIVGHAWRTNGKSGWLFGHAEHFTPNDANAMPFDAADRAAVQAEMVKRFRVVELPRDRLDDSRMDEMASGMLNVIASIARVTRSDQGFVNALISALARYAVVEIKAEKDAEFTDMVHTTIVDRITELRAFVQATEGMREALQEIISQRVANDEPVKH